MKYRLSPLARLRVDKGYTLRDVGNLVGTSGEAVRQWEAGIIIPDTIRAQRYAEALGITQAELNQHLAAAKSARGEVASKAEGAEA